MKNKITTKMEAPRELNLDDLEVVQGGTSTITCNSGILLSGGAIRSPGGTTGAASGGAITCGGAISLSGGTILNCH